MVFVSWLWDIHCLQPPHSTITSQNDQIWKYCGVIPFISRVIKMMDIVPEFLKTIRGKKTEARYRILHQVYYLVKHEYLSAQHHGTKKPVPNS
jgi:hypothetical protein